jgi:hypothetical protein
VGESRLAVVTCCCPALGGKGAQSGDIGGRGVAVHNSVEVLAPGVAKVGYTISTYTYSYRALHSLPKAEGKDDEVIAVAVAGAVVAA